jgi:dienelactone hydrolase
MTTTRSERRDNEVKVATGLVTLEGNLEIPGGAEGVALFAHGSGSGRFSPRNQFVPKVLGQGGLATLLIDLLTREEEEVDRWTQQYRFHIDLLTDRLIGATDWISESPATRSLRIGYFGASTGAAAALWAAAQRPEAVKAVVSRGGRPDLATAAFSQVKASTLLIVGGDDLVVIDLNQRALKQLDAEKELEIVPGASHLFEEPGTLEEVARLACNWFQRYLTSRSEAK